MFRNCARALLLTATTITPLLVAQPNPQREHFQNAEVLYGWSQDTHGNRLRTFVTRPNSATRQGTGDFFRRLAELRQQHGISRRRYEGRVRRSLAPPESSNPAMQPCEWISPAWARATGIAARPTSLQNSQVINRFLTKCSSMTLSIRKRSLWSASAMEAARRR